MLKFINLQIQISIILNILLPIKVCLKRLQLKKDAIPIPYVNTNEESTDTEVCFNLFVSFTFKNYTLKIKTIKK